MSCLPVNDIKINCSVLCGTLAYTSTVSRLTSAGDRSCGYTGPSPPPSRRVRSSEPPPLPLHPSHFCWPQLQSTAGQPDTAKGGGVGVGGERGRERKETLTTTDNTLNRHHLT